MPGPSGSRDVVTRTRLKDPGSGSRKPAETVARPSVRLAGDRAGLTTE